MNSKHDFYLGITHLSRNPGSVMTFNFIGEIKDLRVSSSFIPEQQEIAISGTAEAVHGGIMISGTIFTAWKGECRRCLGEAEGEFEIPVRELFERVDAHEQGYSDGESYPFHGDIIDLREMVKDQVVLELPLAPLCKEDCKGLCASCGADLNKGDCGCSRNIIDPRWSSLDVLIEKER